MIKMKSVTKIMIASILIYILLGFGIYFLIPYLLNYPPGSINNEFQIRVAGMTYTKQFLVIGIILVLINSSAIYILFRKIDNWKNIKISKDKKTIEEIIKIRNTCFNGIYSLMPIQLIIVTVIIVMLLTLSGTEAGLIIKLTAITLVWTIIVNLILNRVIIKLFNKILENTYVYVQEIEHNIKKFGIRKKILFQSTSVMIVIIFILSLFAYSRIVVERSDFLKEKELNEMNNIVKGNNNNLLEYIKSSNQRYFILDEKFNIIYSNGEITKFATEYIKEYRNTNRTYFQYGSVLEGVFINTNININNSTYYIGKIYQVMPIRYAIIIFIFDFVLMLLYLVIINFFAKGIKDDLENCANSLFEIGGDTKSIGTELAVTSNDEFRDLIQAYNKVQKKTKDHIKELEDKQDTIIKQQQLVLLGELAGGMAHDINTPISSINMCIKTMERTIKDDTNKELLKSMSICTSHIIGIVNSLRDQIRNIGDKQKQFFSINDILENTRIMTTNEFINCNCKLEINSSEDLKVFGESNKLTQVIINIVVNSVQAYGTNNSANRKVIITTKSNIENNIIEIRDFAGGIPERIKPFIFKEILTTKGTNGTGVGMYISYSIVKGIFGGDITFESVEGVGTTFSIYIPKSKEEGLI